MRLRRASTGHSIPKRHRLFRLSAEPKQESKPAQPTASAKPVAFVCEDDVRNAVLSHSKIVIGKKTIITPSARELAEANDVFVNE